MAMLKRCGIIVAAVSAVYASGVVASSPSLSYSVSWNSSPFPSASVRLLSSDRLMTETWAAGQGLLRSTRAVYTVVLSCHCFFNLPLSFSFFSRSLDLTFGFSFCREVCLSVAGLICHPRMACWNSGFRGFMLFLSWKGSLFLAFDTSALNWNFDSKM